MWDTLTILILHDCLNIMELLIFSTWSRLSLAHWCYCAAFLCLAFDFIIVMEGGEGHH